MAPISSIRTLCVSALAAGALAFSSRVDTERIPAGFISRSLSRKSGGNNRVLPRQVPGTLDVGVYPEGYVTGTYAGLELLVGNPPQNVTVLLDTGSSVFWVNATCGGLPEADVEVCQNSRFDPTASTTAKDLGFSTVHTYASGEASIEWYTEEIALVGSDVKLQNVTMGVASKTAQSYAGVLGVGFNFEFAQYPNVIELLQTQGLTSSRAFGLGLGNIHKDEGSIVFGGVDTKKFKGNLTTLPLQVIPGISSMMKQTHYAVTLDSLSLDIEGQSAILTSDNQTVILDSGTSLGLLPTDVTLSMAQMLNATFDYYPNYIAVDCNVRDLNATFDFVFAGTTIHVPFAHFIMPPQKANDTHCLVGIQTTVGTTLAPNQLVILGDTFLQDAYVVFDQTNMQVSLAQYVNCGKHEQALPAATTAIQQFVGEC